MWLWGNPLPNINIGGRVHYESALDSRRSRKVYGSLYMKMFCPDNNLTMSRCTYLEPRQTTAYPNALQIHSYSVYRQRTRGLTIMNQRDVLFSSRISCHIQGCFSANCPFLLRQIRLFHLKYMPYTMADTCQILFFSGISNACGIQGGANISNTF